MKSRSIFRLEAKKAYKQQIKSGNVSKKNRLPFAKFFKQYMENKMNSSAASELDVVEGGEDFDFDSMINTNEISDEDVETEESGEEE